jgi:hypothetical protein
VGACHGLVDLRAVAITAAKRSVQRNHRTATFTIKGGAESFRWTRGRPLP